MGGSSGGGGSSTSSGTQTNTVRFAPYIESQHQTFLSVVANYRNSLIGASPFSNFVGIDTDAGFLGVGITIKSYSSLFKNFNDFMVDVVPQTLYDTIFSKVMSSPAIKESIVAEGKLLSEDVNTEAYPRLMAGARDLNAVMSSTFIIAKGNIESQRLRLLSKYSTGLKYAMLPIISDIWNTSLEWNKQIVNTHLQNLQIYYDMKKTTDEYNYTSHTKNTMWPFTVLDQERAALGALQGAQSSESIQGGGASTGAKVVGGAMTGAAMGGMLAGASSGAVAGPVGMAVGGVLGGLSGLL